MNTHFMPAATMSAAKQEKGVSSERLNIRIYPQQKKLIIFYKINRQWKEEKKGI